MKSAVLALANTSSKIITHVRDDFDPWPWRCGGS